MVATKHKRTMEKEDKIFAWAMGLGFFLPLLVGLWAAVIAFVVAVIRSF